MFSTVAAMMNAMPTQNAHSRQAAGARIQIRGHETLPK